MLKSDAKLYYIHCDNKFGAYDSHKDMAAIHLLVRTMETGMIESSSPDSFDQFFNQARWNIRSIVKRFRYRKTTAADLDRQKVEFLEKLFSTSFDYMIHFDEGIKHSHPQSRPNIRHLATYVTYVTYVAGQRLAVRVDMICVEVDCVLYAWLELRI